MTERSLLTVNSGSSSIKYGLATFAASPATLARGTLAAAGRSTAAHEILTRLAAEIDVRPLAGIGHRVVHGGPTHSAPQLVTDELLGDLNDLVSLAPNHLPDSIALLKQCLRQLPGLPQVVCFDTAFHSTLPEHVRRLPIPRSYHDQGVRKYGFHGLSYEFLAQELLRIAGPVAANGKLVFAHLGSGSSLVAVREGRSIDTTMAFTPLGGVAMSTRSGDLDPGVVTSMARDSGLDADELEHVLSQASGLAGISGRSGDMRDLLAHEATDDNCRLAVTIYCYEIKKRIGAYAAALGGLDALVFSGGIGEHAAMVRARICTGLEFLGIRLDEVLNATNALLVSRANVSVPVYVIPADEEMMIARAAYSLLERPHR